MRCEDHTTVHGLLRHILRDSCLNLLSDEKTKYQCGEEGRTHDRQWKRPTCTCRAQVCVIPWEREGGCDREVEKMKNYFLSPLQYREIYTSVHPGPNATRSWPHQAHITCTAWASCSWIFAVISVYEDESKSKLVNLQVCSSSHPRLSSLISRKGLSYEFIRSLHSCVAWLRCERAAFSVRGLSAFFSFCHASRHSSTSREGW